MNARADISTFQEHTAAVMYAANAVRDRQTFRNDAVLNGDFDRFIVKLARFMAYSLWREYGDDKGVSVDDLVGWHGDGLGNPVTRANFETLCSAHGIPQEILAHSAVSGADHFGKHYSRYMLQLCGWETTTA